MKTLVRRRFQIAMRRALYSALTLLIVAALVAPLQTGESAGAPLPACCLVHGEHHCMGQILGGDSDVPVFSAANHCPYSPLALAAMQSRSLPPPAAGVALKTVLQSVPLAVVRISSSDSPETSGRSQRGPPVFSL